MPPFRRLVLAAGALAAPPALARESGPRLDALKAALQSVLDDVAGQHEGTAIQLGWKSATMEFSLASGVVRVPGKPERPTTADDTFLFGSGVKPFTAAAVMALRDRGVLSLDDPLEKHADPALNMLKPGSSIRGLFGERAGKITVGHVLRMQSGVQDFDFPEFDNRMLQDNETYKIHSPYEFVEYASEQKPPLLFEPGERVSYSSNNFVLAGLVLLSHANVSNWWELDVASFLPSDDARRSLGRSIFLQRENLQEHLTVPGHTGGGWAKTEPRAIWNQSSTILGWTCGNLVATAGDVAGFMWGMLGPEPTVLPVSTVEEMKVFKPLDLGWAAGVIQYGAGLMTESVRPLPGHPPTVPEWGTYVGHGGDTYGFLSEQGVISGLDAAVSIVAAQDTATTIVAGEAFCRTIQVGAKILRDVDLSHLCRRSREEYITV